MKTYIYLIILMALGCSGYAQTRHEWKVTLKVTDESSNPIVAANARIGYYIQNAPASIDGLTDTNGIFTGSRDAFSGILGFSAKKMGYYITRNPSYDLGFPYDSTRWNHTEILVLKAVKNPIPMYAKAIHDGPPATNQHVGYDLMRGDWVTPFGKGLNSDIFFTREINKKSALDYDRKISVSFPNEGDGIQEFDVPFKLQEGSELRSSHEAPIDGYKSEIVRMSIHHPGQPQVFDFNENRGYYFRVQTVLDGNHQLKKALYGKIYGDFMRFHYYLNPISNSRNVEFDPKQNLLKTVSKMDAVSDP